MPELECRRRQGPQPLARDEGDVRHERPTRLARQGDSETPFRPDFTTSPSPAIEGAGKLHLNASVIALRAHLLQSSTADPLRLGLRDWKNDLVDRHRATPTYHAYGSTNKIEATGKPASRTHAGRALVHKSTRERRRDTLETVLKADPDDRIRF